jgi:insulysin
MHGNFELEDVHRMLVAIETPFQQSLPLPVTQRFSSNRTHLLPESKSIVYERQVSNLDNVNSAIEYYVQVGDSTDRELRTRLALFQQIVNEPAFDQLRTKEQLGYIVFSSIRKQTGVVGFRILIQSEKSPGFVETRIESFIDSLQDRLNQMTEEEFGKHKKALVTKLLERLKNLAQESNRLWNHINSGYYEFDQHLLDADLIQSLTLDDIKAFYENYIHLNAKTRRKMSVHLKSKGAADCELSQKVLKSSHVVSPDELHVLKSQLPLGKGAAPVKPVVSFLYPKSHI